jgi:dCTP diphosphatase
MPKTTIDELTNLALAFREERDWKQFHNPKDVVLSLSLEVAELVEIMQWRNGLELQKHLVENQKHVGQELSDVLYWILVLAHDLKIDLGEAFREKLQHNAAKYPVEKARGLARKYTELK